MSGGRRPATVCSAAARGTTTRGTSARRTATGTRRRSATTTTASVSPCTRPNDRASPDRPRMPGLKGLMHQVTRTSPDARPVPQWCGRTQMRDTSSESYDRARLSLAAGRDPVQTRRALFVSWLQEPFPHPLHHLPVLRRNRLHVPVRHLGTGRMPQPPLHRRD